MSYKNMGTFDLGRSVSGSAGAGKAATYAMDAAGIASGQAFLTSELEKRDTMIRTPLTSLWCNGSGRCSKHYVFSW